MPDSSSVDGKFLAYAWEMIERAHQVGVQCSIVWRMSDEDFTCISSVTGSSAVRAMLIEVVARSVIADGHSLEELGDVAAADYQAARKARQVGDKNCGET